MLEVFRMQVRQILGGRMKWLVILALALPVLLTLAATTSGGFNEIRREIEQDRLHDRIAAGFLPDGLEPVFWEGEDRTFEFGFELTDEGILAEGRAVGTNEVHIINDGWIVVRDGELWVDESRAPRDPRYRSHRTLNRRPDREQGTIRAGGITLQLITAVYLFVLYPQVICLLLALLYGTSILGHELDGKTLPYLFTRPLPRWRFVTGKYLGIVASLIVPTSVSLAAAWFLMGALSDLKLLLAVWIGTLGALLAYNAVFSLFGFLTPRRGMIVALLYGIIFELILSFAPALVNQVTVTYYLRSLVVEFLDLEVPRQLSRMVGGASLSTAALSLGAIIAVTLGLSSLMAARREYVVKDDA